MRNFILSTRTFVYKDLFFSFSKVLPPGNGRFLLFEVIRDEEKTPVAFFQRFAFRERQTERASTGAQGCLKHNFLSADSPSAAAREVRLPPRCTGVESAASSRSAIRWGRRDKTPGSAVHRRRAGALTCRTEPALLLHICIPRQRFFWITVAKAADVPQSNGSLFQARSPHNHAPHGCPLRVIPATTSTCALQRQHQHLRLFFASPNLQTDTGDVTLRPSGRA